MFYVLGSKLPEKEIKSPPRRGRPTRLSSSPPTDFIYLFVLLLAEYNRRDSKTINSFVNGPH